MFAIAGPEALSKHSANSLGTTTYKVSTNRGMESVEGTRRDEKTYIVKRGYPNLGILVDW